MSYEALVLFISSIITCCLFGGTCYTLYKNRQKPWLSIAFMVYFFLATISFPIVSYLFPGTELAQIHISYSRSELANRDALGLLVLSLTALLIGIVALTAFQSRNRQLRSGSRDARERFLFPAITIAAVGSVLFLSFLSNSGILSNPALIALYRTGQFGGSGMYTYALLNVLPAITTLHICSIPVGVKRSFLRKAATAFLIFLSIAAPVALGFRFYALLSIVSFILAMRFSGRTLSAKKTILGAACLFSFFSFYAVVRQNIETRGLNNEFGAAEIALSTFARSQSTQRLDLVLRAEPEYMFFVLQIPEALSGLIPPSLRPKFFDNSTRFGMSVMNEYIYWRDGGAGENFGGHATTLVGYGYWQAGWFGVIVIAILIGFLLGRTDALLTTSNSPLLKKAVFAQGGAAVFLSVDAPGEMFNLFILRVTFMYFLYFAIDLFTRGYRYRGRTLGPKST